MYYIVCWLNLSPILHSKAFIGCITSLYYENVKFNVLLSAGYNLDDPVIYLYLQDNIGWLIFLCVIDGQILTDLDLYLYMSTGHIYNFAEHI